MNVIRVFGLLTCMLLATSLLAQDTTVYQLDSTQIYTTRTSKYSTGSKVETLPTDLLGLYKNVNLSDLLTSQSGIFMKSYGMGGIATSSFRGTAAEHTAVIWNGFSIVNPMLGLFDFSLVPGGFIDDISIQYGNTTALFGSGAIGGVIHLRSNPRFNEGNTLTLGGNQASFNTIRQQGGYTYSGKKFISKTQVFNYTADNNFEYVDTEHFRKPTLKLQHARVEQYGVKQDNYYKINKNQQIGFHYWHQQKEAQIPRTLTQTESTAVQKDRFNRMTLDWTKKSNKTLLQARTGYFNNWVNFEDKGVGILSSNHYISHITETEVTHDINEASNYSLGYNHTYISSSSISSGKSNLLNGNPTRNQHALFGSYQQYFFNKKLLANVSSRVEVIDGDAKPVTPALAFEYAPNKHHTVRAKASRNYRVPTLNNLYWASAGARGNPNLMPELGWSEEIGYNFKTVGKKQMLELDATAYNSYINNWMLWIEENDIWSPQNVREVWSRGLELSMTYAVKVLDSGMIKLSGKYNYIQSTIEATDIGDSSLLGKQLIYVPEQSAIANLTFIYRGMFFNVNANHTGWRFITTDNEKSLQPYGLINLALSKQFNYKTHQLSIIARANNILNEEYEILRYRPTPKANYEIGLNLTLNKINK